MAEEEEEVVVVVDEGDVEVGVDGAVAGLK